MTKKDYELIARELHDVTTSGSLCLDSADDCRSLCQGFANALQADNPRFDRDTFAAACGYDSAHDMDTFEDDQRA